MKKNKIIQFSLVIGGIILFFFTYYYSDKDKIVDIDKNILIGDVVKLTEETSNIIENVNYVGTNNKGTFFELNAAIAEIKYDNPNISYLQDVFVVIKLSNLRTIRIRSDKAVFNKISNDCEFFGNVEITEQDNIITSDNLDLYMSKNLITCNLNTSVTELMEIITNNKIRHIPIMEEKKLLGIISIGDVVNYIIDQYKEENQYLRENLYLSKKHC